MTEWDSFLIKLLGISLASLLIVFLGKYDQKKKMAIWLKLLLQGLIALLVISFGVRIEFLRNSLGGYWYLTYFSIPVTLIWLLVITNSLGQTDELGDLTPSMVFIASLTFLFVSIFQRQGLVLAEILSVALMICSLIILVLKKKGCWKESNFSAYSMFFGFMLAVIAILGVMKSTAALTLLSPLLILGFPIIDTSYSFIAGLREDEYFGFANDSKLRQQLINQGFSGKGANTVMLFTSIYLSLLAVMISIREDIYLFTAMMGIGLIAFYWLKEQVSKNESIMSYDAVSQRIELFGVPIDRINCRQAIERIDEFVRIGIPHQVVTPDTLAIVRAKRDSQYLQITREANLVTPDGAGLLWATTTLDVPLIERITGIDLIHLICHLAVEKKYRLYLLGAKDEIIKKAVESLESRYAGIQIVGYHHGYFQCDVNNHGTGKKSEREIIEDIKGKKPDFLLVGMGVPKQEIWISNHKEELGVPVCIGIGGSFDVISGKIPRAPLWMQKHGMEWIYRLLKEPKRIKRAIALPYFMWLILLGKVELFFRESK